MDRLNTRYDAAAFLRDSRMHLVRRMVEEEKLAGDMDALFLLGNAMTALQTGADHINF